MSHQRQVRVNIHPPHWSPAGGEDRGSLANAGMLGRSGSALGRVGRSVHGLEGDCREEDAGAACGNSNAAITAQ